LLDVWRHVCLGALIAASLPGCSKLLGIEDFSLTPDAPPDVPGPDAQLCWGAGLAPVCLASPAMGVRTLDTALDTDTLGTCSDLVPQPSGPELCVIAATQINVSATVTATGSRPLMLLATDTIQIGGTLDVSSRRASLKPGAGANFASCGAGTGPSTSSVASGGGAGGTFGTMGTRGGDGLNGTVTVPNGTAPTVLGLTFVRGGCKGQDGGDVGASQGGTGGASGGAVYLFAATMITVNGNIYASGAGGSTAAIHTGGGGGGAGGLIGLEAPTIDVTGIVAANGGNGSAGGGTTTAGGAGTDGATMLYNTQPAAQTNGSSGGTGGRGLTATTAGVPAGNGVASGAGGGGGGGGGGIVWVKGTLTGTMIAPPPTLN
jgi:hypothetical protein